jgi:hypothetical protein
MRTFQQTFFSEQAGVATVDVDALGSLPYQPSSPTSKAAAESMQICATSLKEEVYRIISKSEDGMTDEEIQQRLDMNPSTERPRRIELVLSGALRNSGRQRTTRSGRKAVIWEVAA